jgi:hypothetical protein
MVVSGIEIYERPCCEFPVYRETFVRDGSHDSLRSTTPRRHTRE